MSRRTKTEQSTQQPAGLQPPIAWYLQPTADTAPAKPPNHMVRIGKILVGVGVIALALIALAALLNSMMKDRSRIDVLDARISGLEQEIDVPEVLPTPEDTTTPATRMPANRPRLAEIKLEQVAAGDTGDSMIIWVELWDQNNELFSDATTLSVTATAGTFGPAGAPTQHQQLQFTITNGMGQLLFTLPLEGTAAITITAEAREHQSVAPATLQIGAPSSPTVAYTLTLSIDLLPYAVTGMENQEEGTEATAEDGTQVSPAGETVSATLKMDESVNVSTLSPVVVFMVDPPIFAIAPVTLDSNEKIIQLPAALIRAEEPVKITAIILAGDQQSLVDVTPTCDLSALNYRVSSQALLSGSEETDAVDNEIIQLPPDHQVYFDPDSSIEGDSVAVITYLWIDPMYINRDADAPTLNDAIVGYEPSSPTLDLTLSTSFADSANGYPVEIVSLCKNDGFVLVSLEGMVPDGSIEPIEPNG